MTHRRTLCLSLLSLALAGAGRAAGGLVWHPLGEPGGGGAVVAVGVSPHDARHLVASGDMLGAAVSFDGGDSWQPALGFLTYEMCDVTFHPTDPQVVWLGSCSGPYKSVDGGRHWVSKRAGMPATSTGKYTAIVEKIAFDPDQPGRLLACGGTSRHWNECDTFGWIWESLDDGETWRHLATLARDGCSTAAKKGVNVWRLQYEPGSGRRLHLLADALGWWSSDDDGRTWTRQSASGVSGEISGLTFSPRDARTVWVTTRNRRAQPGDQQLTPGGIFRSTDGGRTFAASDTGITKVATNDGNQTTWFQEVAVSAADPNVLYANDQAWNVAAIYKSTDGGGQWTPIASRGGPTAKLPGVFQCQTATLAGIALALRCDPHSADRVYGYNSEFILRSADGGRTWDDATARRPDPARPDRWRGRGWNGWCATNFAWNPYRRGQAVAQGMDGSRAWITDDDGRSWHYALGQAHPWLGGVDVGFSRDGAIWVTTGQFGHQNGLQRSTDWGQTWTTLAGARHGLPEAGWGQGPEWAGVFVHPDDGKRVWAVLGGDVLATADGGETWRKVLTGKGCAHVAGDPTKPGRFYVASKEGLLVTEDGATFTNLAGPQPATRGRLNCDARGRVLVCKFRESRWGLWRYTPADRSWERLLDEFGAMEANADPSDPTRLLLVTSQDPYYDLASGNGVWLSIDDGRSWSRANDNLPMWRNNACAFNPHDPEQVVIGSYGMGFFSARWAKTWRPAGDRRYVATPDDRLASAAQASLLANGSMTDGTDQPDGWTQTWDKVTVKRDTAVFRSAPAALHVVATGANGQVFQQLSGHAGERFRLTGWVRTRNRAKYNVAVMAFDAAWKRNAFDQVKYLQDTNDWTAFDKEVTIPTWAARFNVLVLIEGQGGEAWLDDVALVPVAATPATVTPPPPTDPPPANAPLAQVKIANGGMVQGHLVPAGWGGDGRRDATVFKEGPAALRVDAAGRSATAQMRLDGLAGKRVKIAGYIKSRGQVKAQAALHAFAEGWRNNQFQQLRYVQNDTDWTAFEKEVVVPAWAAWCELKLLVEGTGSAWLDELHDPALPVDAGQPVSALDEMRAAPPPKDKPWVPGWCIYGWRSAWFGMHDGFVARSQRGGIDVVALGDSLTMGWGVGVDKLVKAIDPKLTAVNYGIGGDSTRQILWRVGHGEADALKPQVVVLGIGTNNLYDDQNGGSDAEIAQGVEACVKLLRAKLPAAKILLLSILPRQNDYFCTRIYAVNRALAKLADGQGVVWHDRTARFQTGPGKLRRELYNKDELHLEAPGYEVWNADLEPVLRAMLR